MIKETPELDYFNVAYEGFVETESLGLPFKQRCANRMKQNRLPHLPPLLPKIQRIWERLLGRWMRRGKEDGGKVDTGKNVNLSAVQSAILLGMGLQRKNMEEQEIELSLPVNQILALFIKIIWKISKRLLDIQKEGIAGSGCGRIADTEDSQC
ncbi:hypothetical protein D9758_011403 [Tetrapyrgos nigripes]|uniref:Possible tRNA binding domain-containing protein n=1 Tax=Tetrapyrgos nigripes TaxID=182062 RepID=A0A8H5CRT3_9AGAR|nr:hypothetical protein D9758_011403 [Tetrapyrgos nigripes]